MEYRYAQCFILLSCAILFKGCIGDEMHDIFFKLLSNEKRLISNEKRIDQLETQFKNSMENLSTKVSTELSKITQTLQQYEPGMAEIREDIRDTISNTVTQMVKSQFTILNKAMKQEKAGMLNTQYEVKEHMDFVNNAFNNSLRNYEEQFKNQTAELQDELKAQKEKAEDFIKKLFNESEDHAHQLTDDFEHAQGIFEILISNQTEALNSKFNKQTDKIDHLIKTVLNDSEDLHQTVEAYTEEARDTEQNLKEELQETLKQMKNEQFENLTVTKRALNSRLTSLENALSSLSSRLTSDLSSFQGNLRSYKSTADSMGSRVSSIEGRMTSHHVGFFAELTDKLPSISKNTRIVFNDEKYDGWYDYNSSTGIFTAPISGMYLFMFTIQCYPSKLAKVCLYISGSCRSYGYAKGDDYMTNSNFYVTYLNAGTQVWVQTRDSQSTYSIYPYRTTFSGVLIHI